MQYEYGLHFHLLSAILILNSKERVSFRQIVDPIQICLEITGIVKLCAGAAQNIRSPRLYVAEQESSQFAVSTNTLLL